MNARMIEITPTLKMVAATERERLTGFLSALDTARQAQATCATFDSCQTVDSAAAREALDACVMAEDRVLGLALDPGLAVFMGLVLDQLTDIAGDRSCA